MHLQCSIPTCLHIHNRLYCDADFGLLTFNELISTTRCQGNQYSIHSLVCNGQFEKSQNILKYRVSQLSSLNLVS